jgi:SOUL heme-binding protein
MLGAMLRLTRQLLDAAGSIVGTRGGIEEPAHTVEQLTSAVELRRYGSRIAAETTVTADEEAARSAGFRRLAGYIFGGNHTDTKIAMTAPVVQQPSGVRGETISMTAPVSQSAGDNGQWVIRFFMPAGKTMKSLPKPNDPAVRLMRVPPETVAVRRFSGGWSHRAVASQIAQLMRALRETGFEPIGTPAAWFYDPPWTIPMLRRNEIAVPVKAN